MSKRNRFREELSEVPFESYEEYMDYIFACVNVRLTDYIENLMGKYATGQGQYKNIMYPDIEIAYNLCNDNVLLFSGKDLLDEDEVNEGTPLEETFSGLDDELQDLLGAFSEETQDADEEEAEEAEA